jgi:hypothetical protein
VTAQSGGRASERACVVQRRNGKRGPREGHTSCVCPYVWVVRWIGGHPRVHAAQRGAPVHPGYAATRARRAALHEGLDDVFSAASARPTRQAARGFVVELRAQASRLEQRWAAIELRALDGWPARRQEFGRREHTGAEQGGIGGRRPQQVGPICQ